MLTFFTTAKPFRGHSAIIQRNALQSWKLLAPDMEVILFGDDEGAAEAASELKIRHQPRVERNESGLKRIDSMFECAEEIGRHDVLCYVNCDIILTGDFRRALEQVRATHGKFLMVGRRWDTDITEPIDFLDANWEEDARRRASAANHRRDEWFIDYFAFSRGLYRGKIPPFVIGRVRWDNWLIWSAGARGAAVVDASDVVRAIHQNHDYGYHPLGREGVWNDEQSARNLELAGGWEHLRTMKDATFILRPEGLKPNRMRHWNGLKWRVSLVLSRSKVVRVWTYEIWLPTWHLLLGITRPLRSVLGLRSEAMRRSSSGSRGKG